LRSMKAGSNKGKVGNEGDGEGKQAGEWVKVEQENEGSKRSSKLQ